MSLGNFINITHNQHFISQAEQRLNSCSLEPHSKKAEIYSFSIADRNPPKVLKGTKNKIHRNLSFQDLFTLLRLDKTKRLNLEFLFKKYEDNYPSTVTELLKLINKVRDSIKEKKEGIDLKAITHCDFLELVDLIKKVYIYKTMNWLRNPYQIKRILKIFEPFINHCLSEPDAIRLHIAPSKKDNAEERHICNTYGISHKEYKEWIRLLLMFLYTQENNSNSLEGFSEEFFLAREFCTIISIHLFDEHCVLLPDTGVIKDSIPEGQVTYMNISKECMIALQHTVIDGRYLDEAIKEEKKQPENMREIIKNSLERSIFGKLYINDLPMLAGYNQICVKGSALKVFSATPAIYGVEIIENQSSDEA
ncbi:hypothetical protein ACSC9U_19075 [Pseudomonas solani]|uniref:hypothetical protein n=1 Tax=Pseudomonas solani TaxID=2731552 RepID=UPI003F4AA829